MEQSREPRDKKLGRALKQAVRALRNFPPCRRVSSVAVALFNTGKYPQALNLPGAARQRPITFALEYLARIHERMGTTDAWSQLYPAGRFTARTALGHTRDRGAARGAAATPDADDQRLRMVAGIGQPQRATAEYIELARRCQSASRIEEATVLSALRIDSSNREAKG